jgi:hypothetical protein
MSIFGQKVSLAALIKEIPDMKLKTLAESTGVDYYTKDLDGKLMFYLLFYSLLCIKRMSLRGLADVFSSPLFRFLFNYQGKKQKISHSSLSERLSVINTDFFRLAYECLYKRLSHLYTKKEIAGMYLQRVDSTLVKDCSGRLLKGLVCGNEYRKCKMLKYTINFDGMFGSFSALHSESAYASESLALPENVIDHCRKEKEHASVYVIDRGQSSADAFKKMKDTEGLLFVGRLLENRRMKHIRELPPVDEEKHPFRQGELKSDTLVHLYKMADTVGRNGQAVRKQVLVDEEFRVIRFRPPGKDEDIVLITNIIDLSADEIASTYRLRWDIEVFFRFIKQELNFSHFLSLNENGIQVMLYMTLITAMLIMIYKKENAIGYKTAVRRICIEMEELILAMAVMHCGGDVKRMNVPYPLPPPKG